MPSAKANPATPSRCRSALLWGLAFFLFGQLGLTVGLEGPLTRLRDPEFGCKLAALRRQQARRPTAPLVVVLGSSRVGEGVRPGVLDPWATGAATEPIVFNFALVGAGPVMQLLCLNRLLDAGIRPDWVLVEYWLPFCDQDGPRAEENRIDVTRLAWADVRLLEGYWQQPARLRLDYAEARLVPWFAHRFGFLNQWAPAWVPFLRQELSWRDLDEWGWRPNHSRPAYGTAEYRRRLAAIESNCGPLLRLYHPSALSDRALRELLGRCRREGIGVALFVMPEGPEFRALYPRRTRAAADGYVRRLATEYGAPLVDCREWAPDDAFSDSFHLLPDAAAAFSRRLGAEVVLPLLQGKLAAGDTLSRLAAAGRACGPKSPGGRCP